MVAGRGATASTWQPDLLQTLASGRQVTIFDNRGRSVPLYLLPLLFLAIYIIPSFYMNASHNCAIGCNTVGCSCECQYHLCYEFEQLEQSCTHVQARGTGQGESSFTWQHIMQYVSLQDADTCKHLVH